MRLFLILTTFLLINSCASYENRGYSFSNQDYDFIKVGFSKKDHIHQELGEPTISEKNISIYFGEKTKKYLFFRPKAIERKIIFIEFDKSNIVSYVEEFNLNLQKQIDFNEVRSLNFVKDKNNFSKSIKDIFKNIGQISAN